MVILIPHCWIWNIIMNLRGLNLQIRLSHAKTPQLVMDQGTIRLRIDSPEVDNRLKNITLYENVLIVNSKQNF